MRSRVQTDPPPRVRDLTLLERTINGQSGLVGQQDGITVMVVVDIADAPIKHIWAVGNLEKLRSWTMGWRAHTNRGRRRWIARTVIIGMPGVARLLPHHIERHAAQRGLGDLVDHLLEWQINLCGSNSIEFR